eukprot:4709563-Prymnesium_polylepis.2
MAEADANWKDEEQDDCRCEAHVEPRESQADRCERSLDHKVGRSAPHARWHKGAPPEDMTHTKQRPEILARDA